MANPDVSVVETDSESVERRRLKIRAGRGQVPPPEVHPLTSAELQQIASDNGLRQMGVRPSLSEYVRQMWERRSFTHVLASSRAYARNQGNYLGQAWSVLNPLLNAVVYVTIFGFIMQTRRGLDNVIAFIVVGTFTYRAFDQVVVAGGRSVSKNLSLVRSIHFPRAVLPLASTLTEVVSFLPAAAVMCIIAYASALIPGMGSVPLTWRLLLLPLALALMFVFAAGCAFLLARWVAVTPDLANIVPFVMRFVMYGSGVIFSIDHFVHDSTLAAVLTYQPVGVYLHLIRSCILNEPSITMSPVMWAAGVGWALVFLAWGFLTFWRSEERYGRD